MPNLLPSTAIIVTTERSNCMDYIAVFIYFIQGDSQRYVCHNSYKNVRTSSPTLCLHNFFTPVTKTFKCGEYTRS